MVLELGGDLALQPDAGRVGAAEELVRGQPVVDAQPVGELALGAAHAGKARDPGAKRHVAVEHVAQVAGAHHLRRVALRRVRGPDVEVVAELRRQEPAGERQEELVELDVLALLDRLGIAEGVHVGRVQSLLVQVARVAEEPDVDLALLPGDDPEAGVGDVLQRLRLLLRLLDLLDRLRQAPADDELGAAAVRDPDARVVVTPGLAEEARGLAPRAGQGDTLRRVGRTHLPLTGLRGAGHDRRLGRETARQRHEQDGGQQRTSAPSSCRPPLLCENRSANERQRGGEGPPRHVFNSLDIQPTYAVATFSIPRIAAAFPPGSAASGARAAAAPAPSAG